jgi:hypothetical protein
LNVPDAVGVPEIVSVPAANDPLTPAGNPETDAPVALPPVAYVIGAIAVLMQTVCASEPAADVNATVGAGSPVITTSSNESRHGALEIVQRNVFGPTPRPVTADVGELGVVIVPDPLISVHTPVPTVGVFPASVAFGAQNVWSGPAFAGVGGAGPVITTVSVEGVHGGFVIVQTKVFGPAPSPVMPEVGELGEVIVPDPLISVQVPVPTTGVFPERVLDVQAPASGPALAAVGAVFTSTLIGPVALLLLLTSLKLTVVLLKMCVPGALKSAAFVTTTFIEAPEARDPEVMTGELNVCMLAPLIATLTVTLLIAKLIVAGEKFVIVTITVWLLAPHNGEVGLTSAVAPTSTCAKTLQASSSRMNVCKTFFISLCLVNRIFGLS